MTGLVAAPLMVVTPLLVASAVLAGGLGAVARYAVSRAFARQSFPWAVLIVNLAGCAIAGAVLALPADPQLRLILLSGFAGGLTTFSTFAVESVQLGTARRTRALLLSVAANVVGGLAVLAVAWLATRALL